jgi:hypothetical protein
MRSTLFFMVTAFLIFGQSAFAGGGVVVGNGAGIVENNFQQAYQSLDTIIQNCLNIENCSLQDDERVLVTKILAIVKRNSSKTDRLIFTSEKAHPGFFTTGEAETNRVAKTELSPESPIFINTDMLYDLGKPTLTFENIVALLIHEIGHQTGKLEHTALDILGVKIGNFSESLTDHFGFVLDDKTKESVVFSVTNFTYPAKSTSLQFNWKNAQNVNLSNSLVASSTCKYDSETFAGTEVSNGHFSFNDKNNLVFEAWVKVSCFESFSGETFIYRKNIEISLDDDYKIISLIVE